MELTQLEEVRLAKAERLRQSGAEPYPARVERTHTAAEAIAAFEAAEAAGEVEPSLATGTAERLPPVAVVGRLRSFRTMGKTSFGHIEDGTGQIQIMLRINDLGEEAYRAFEKDFDLGDFLEVHGLLFRTRTGEITVRVERYRMLAKALSAPPEKWHGLKDVETRYRQRYADLLSNPEVRELFRTRARITAAARRFLDSRGFLEVETPVLQPIYGGAAARPFITHHNELEQDLYLRISFELYLKRLLVGGYERVYEIGKDFRNEGVSFKHNPEFTQLEFYMAYADYRQVMELTEEMIAYVADEVLGRREIAYGEHIIHLNPPWARFSLGEAIGQRTGIDIGEYRTADSLYQAIVKAGLKANPNATRGKLIDGLIGDFIEPNLIQPTFLYDYPRDISPLAKSKPGDALTVERFEGFVAGMELCNAFSELNDPVDQEARFLETRSLYGAEDEETHPLDEDYLRAMRYGMPPNGGFGMGIDRLTMLFTGKSSIREVILYPQLRTGEGGE